MIGTIPWNFGPHTHFKTTQRQGIVRRWRFYKLGNWQKLAGQAICNMEGNGNEIADQLAKEGREKEQPPSHLSYREV